jgi:hypothetical protein
MVLNEVGSFMSSCKLVDCDVRDLFATLDLAAQQTVMFRPRPSGSGRNRGSVGSSVILAIHRGNRACIAQ